MKLESLTEEHLLEIVRLYEERCGNGRSFKEAMFLQSPWIVLENIKSNKRRGAEYRIGSRWDGHSKILLLVGTNDEIIVGFNPNFDPRDRMGQEYEEAEKAGRKFEEEVIKYLKSQI